MRRDQEVNLWKCPFCGGLYEGKHKLVRHMLVKHVKIFSGDHRLSTSGRQSFHYLECPCGRQFMVMMGK